jgi:hypothetical protein
VKAVRLRPSRGGRDLEISSHGGGNNAHEEIFYITPEEAEVATRLVSVFDAEDFANTSAVEVDTALTGDSSVDYGNTPMSAADISEATQTVNQLFGSSEAANIYHQ